jgi:hypothetical protein
VILRGSAGALNNALDGLTPNNLANGTNYLDLLLVPDSGAASVSGVVPITISGTGPALYISKATVTGVGDFPFNLSYSNYAGIGLHYSDSGNIATVYLQVGAGTLTVTNTYSLASMSGNGTSLLEMSGTEFSLGLALNTLVFTAPPLYRGADPLSVMAVHDGTTVAGMILNVVPGTALPTVDGPHAQETGISTANGTNGVVFTAANGNAITLGPNDPGDVETLYVQVQGGTLTVPTVNGPPVTISGQGSSRVTLTGSRLALNAALEGLTYVPNPGATSDFLNVLLYEPATLAGSAKSASLGVVITVNSNSPGPAPFVSGPACQAVNVGGATFSQLNGNAIRVAAGYPESGPSVTVTLQVLNGTLATIPNDRVALYTADHAVTLIGTVADINEALDGLHYTPPSSSYSDFLSVLVSTGQASATLGVSIGTLNSPNLPPSVTAPAAQSVAAGSVLVFAQGTNNAIVVADGDSAGGIETVYLQSQNDGLFAVAASPFLTSVVGNGTSFLALSGTVAALNRALDGLQYAPLSGATSDWLSVLIDDNGNSGGPAQTASAGIGIVISR